MAPEGTITVRRIGGVITQRSTGLTVRIAGPPGPAGPAGAEGPQGDAGPQGPAGTGNVDTVNGDGGPDVVLGLDDLDDVAAPTPGDGQALIWDNGVGDWVPGDVAATESDPIASTALADHEADTVNPHSVTKTQVGLANADNTADSAKPVSTAQQTALDARQLTSQKDQANGYPGLDGAGLIPASKLPSSAMEFKGLYNASTNTPSLSNGTGSAGDFYKISVAGSRNFGAGSISFEVGDAVVYDGSVWAKLDASDAVTSVDGLSGAVLLPADAAAGTASKRTLGTGALQAAPGTVQAELDALIPINTTGLVDGDLIQYSSGEFVRYAGGLTANPNVPHARVFNNAAISIPNAAITPLTFNSERWDNASIHSTVANTGRLTCPTGGAGLWSPFANIKFNAHATGVRLVRIRLNDTTTIAQDQRNAGAADFLIALTTQYRLVATDYVTVEVFQDSGGALNCGTLPNAAPEFGMALMST